MTVNEDDDEDCDSNQVEGQVLPAARLLCIFRQPIAAPVAQLDRASDFGSEGWEFESLRVYQAPSAIFLGEYTVK